jgi:hypothetical protein
MRAPAGNGTTINRLRIQARGLDPLTAQVRTRRLLDDAALQPPSLGPRAILCIRRLADPRPGLATLESRSPAPARWTDAVRALIGERARDAARPARGDVSADAQAVMFADRAELLACLARDWCAGVAGVRWWWPALLGESAGDDAVLSAWLATPQHIAAAFEETARLGVAARFVRRFDRGNVRALFNALTAEHDLRPLAAAIETLLTAGVAQQAGDADSTATTATPGDRNLSSAALAPWGECVPECAASTLRADQACLLGIALTLRRQPWRVRTRGVAGLIERWTDDVGHSGEPRQQAPQSVTDSATAPAPVIARALPARANGWDRKQSGASIQSGVGGVFYLLNVAIALELYGDFTKPAAAGIDLPIWDFVRMAGRQLAPQRFRRDPVWHLLAQLAGRDGGRAVRAPLWLTQELLPHLRSRIARALGIAQSRHAGRLLCVHRARVEITLAHVDVFFSLAAHPIAIRLGGVDRDPGWIPAADRIVTFHYD